MTATVAVSLTSCLRTVNPSQQCEEKDIPFPHPLNLVFFFKTLFLLCASTQKGRNLYPNPMHSVWDRLERPYDFYCIQSHSEIVYLHRLPSLT